MQMNIKELFQYLATEELNITSTETINTEQGTIKRYHIEAMNHPNILNITIDVAE